MCTQKLLRRFCALFAVALAVALAAPALPGMEPLSCGVSKEDRAPHPEYPVKLIFAMQDGAYLADIALRVMNLEGETVLATHSEGPWLFVDLPDGRYVLKAKRRNGDEATARLSVSHGRQSVVTLAWAASG